MEGTVTRWELMTNWGGQGEGRVRGGVRVTGGGGGSG